MAATPAGSTGAIAFRSTSSRTLAASAFCCDRTNRVFAESVIQYFRSPKCLLALFVTACLAGFGWSGSAQADPQSFKVPLSGAREVPPVETPATGAADITYDPATRVVSWVITYSGLSGPATAAHLHGPAGQEGKAPLVVWMSKQGSPAENPIEGQATLTPEQAQQLAAGQWYVNVHTQANPGGEIRGQVIPPKT